MFLINSIKDGRTGTRARLTNAPKVGAYTTVVIQEFIKCNIKKWGAQFPIYSKALSRHCENTVGSTSLGHKDGRGGAARAARAHQEHGREPDPPESNFGGPAAAWQRKEAQPPPTGGVRAMLRASA